MKNPALTLLIVIVTFSNSFGQKLIPIGDNFLHGEKYIDKSQVKGIMSKDTEAYNYFSKSQDQFASARRFGITSIVTLSSGFLIAVASTPAATFSESAKQTVAFGGILILTGCVSGTVGLIKKKRAKRNLELSLLLYNRMNTKEENISYDIDLTFDGNGAGIRYSF